MPQEIEVWYLIPGLRRELAKILINEYELSQKEVADLLRITESAVSQYLKLKRGAEMKFSEDELVEVKKYAEKMIGDRENSNDYLYKLCLKFRGSENLCELHRKHDSTLPEKCDLCC
ncbi:transcriptional regulator [Candidatus Pacearchaeota archaeon]|nr:transcriptional regulator [Candidatus Pacearchaeota archaeon]